MCGTSLEEIKGKGINNFKDLNEGLHCVRYLIISFNLHNTLRRCALLLFYQCGNRMSRIKVSQLLLHTSCKGQSQNQILTNVKTHIIFTTPSSHSMLPSLSPMELTRNVIIRSHPDLLNGSRGHRGNILFTIFCILVSLQTPLSLSTFF